MTAGFRNEYPRPQMVRREWQSLNGEWEFQIDDADTGLRQGWQDGRPLAARITVPFAYQCELSGIGDKGIHEVVWYARDLQIPESWRGKEILLHFGAVDYQCTLWINGQEVGHNQGGHVPFSFNITRYLQPESVSRLTLRVVDRQDPRQPRGKQASSGIPQGIDYYCTTGIWQSVWMEPVSRFRIDDLRINPQAIEDAIHMLIYLHAPSTRWTLEVDALDGDQVVARVAQETVSAAAGVRVPIPGAKRWSPDSPHLYGLRIRLRHPEGELLDEVESYAGLRRIELRDGRFCLNGEPAYLKMVLDQGYWPGGYLTAPSDAALREDVEWIKRFGFNGVRKHQKVEDPRWLMWCDRLGLLVWGEMPNGRAWSSEAEEWLMAEWERAVRRDYSHPCIVTWVPVNESMGFPNLREDHPGQYAFLERIVSVTRRLDPDRPVIDNDGWEHTDITDIVAVHDYSHSGEALEKIWKDARAPSPVVPARIWTGSRAVFAVGASYHGQPVMLTEVGGLLMRPNRPLEELDRLYAVYASFDSHEEVLDRYEDILRGISRLPLVAGFCYTQLTDIEQEINGLLTFDREPKVPPERIAQIHADLFPP